MSEATGAQSKVCAGCGTHYPGDALFCPIDGMPLQSAASAGHDAEDDPYLGQEISGHIEIRQLVGIGAMGRVYRAFQRGIDRDVAVKILHRELSSNAQLVSRFTREAKVASRLQHPNVVQVLLAGQLPDRALYMVMEYLEGLSLQSALAAAGGALALPRALHIAMQLCEASGEAHAVGIVHRDLKPENVMLVRRGTDPDFVKVLDFGIARIDWGDPSVATAAGLIFGTARYISPEGAQGNAVGPASDVYAIATLLYQMLSGRTPFEGEQAVGLLVAHIHDAPPPLKSIPRAAYVPDPLAEVIMANLAKDPAHREQDARSFGHAIVDAAKQSGLSQEDISRPMLRRQPSAMQMPPLERTQKHDLSPAMAERLSPPVTGVTGITGRANDSQSLRTSERPQAAATVKWEPPPAFQARLAEAVVTRDRASGIVFASPSSRPVSPAALGMAVPAAPGSRPRSPSGVDETMDDARLESLESLESPWAGRRGTTDIAEPPLPPLPSFPQVADMKRAARGPHAVPGEAEGLPRATEYAAPPSASATAHTENGDAPARPSRGILVVVLCFFTLGAALTAAWAWKMGKLGGGDGDDERYVARAEGAMYKNHFVTPAGDNVREITDEGLKKWPNDHRLLDVRMRTANQLLSQAVTQRSVGDIVEALRLARIAHELDPNDASAKRLIEQYDAELASFTTPTAIPLVKPSPSAIPAAAPPALGTKATASSPPAIGSAAPPALTAYKVVLDSNVTQARLGQTVDFTVRVAPAKGAFENPLFTIAGPGLGTGASMPAQSAGPGVFTASYAFLEAGRFDVTFTTQTDGGKSLKAARVLVAGEPAANKPADPAPKPSEPSPASSVKWM